MNTAQPKNTISNFRAAMAANGKQVTFSEAAKILVDAGIMEPHSDDRLGGYVLSSAIILLATQQIESAE